METLAIAERFNSDPYMVEYVWPYELVEQARILMAAEARRDRWENK